MARYASLGRRVDQTVAALAVPEIAWTAFATVLSAPVSRREEQLTGGLALFQLATELPAAVLAPCPASSSRSRSPRSTLRAATGWPTPPASAAARKIDPMAKLPEPDITHVRPWCEQRVPEHARDQVRMECDTGARHLTIVECRPPWREGTGPEWTRFPIARLRYTQATRTWSSYRRDRNLRFRLTTSSRHHRASMTSCTRSTATRRRSSGDRSGQAQAFGQFQYLLCR
jgi:hypothetical protein